MPFFVLQNLIYGGCTPKLMAAVSMPRWNSKEDIEEVGMDELYHSLNSSSSTVSTIWSFDLCSFPQHPRRLCEPWNSSTTWGPLMTMGNWQSWGPWCQNSPSTPSWPRWSLPVLTTTVPMKSSLSLPCCQVSIAIEEKGRKGGGGGGEGVGRGGRGEGEQRQRG